MSSEEKNSMVADDEQVARIVSHEWVIDGELQLAAFALAPRETYLSVNRPIIDTYDEDVLQFVSAHPYYFDEKKQSYKRALLEVKAVRAISVEKDGLRLNANVEVEPRDNHTKSHAGIFFELMERMLFTEGYCRKDNCPIMFLRSTCYNKYNGTCLSWLNCKSVGCRVSKRKI